MFNERDRSNISPIVFILLLAWLLIIAIELLCHYDNLRSRRKDAHHKESTSMDWVFLSVSLAITNPLDFLLLCVSYVLLGCFFISLPANFIRERNTLCYGPLFFLSFFFLVVF